MGAIDKKCPWQTRSAPKLLALEPRMLFDGAAAVVSVEPTNSGEGVNTQFDSHISNNLETSSIDTETSTSISSENSIQAIQQPIQLDFSGDILSLETRTQQIWLDALHQAQQQLIEFAKSERFQSVLEQIYNPSGVDAKFFTIKVDQLRQQILTTGLNISVELRSSTELNGYLAAYASVNVDGEQRIFVNKDWIDFGLNQQMISKVLLEEIGHAIDFNLNGAADTSGDEGEYFSRVISGDFLVEDDVQRLTSEDDSSVIFIDGIQTAVENATITFTKAYQGMNSTYTAIGSSYSTETNIIYIGNAISSIAFSFQSANPADVQFSGNNVAGQLTYFSLGIKYVINGIVSRPDRDGSKVEALYFSETTVLGGSINTGKAFLLIMPGNESTYTSNSAINTDSSPISTAMNSVLSSQSTNRPPVITSNGGGEFASINFSENTSISTPVTTVTSTDLDSSDTKTYSIYGGADAALFQINSSTGVLTFKTSPDYETPTDADRNNIYDVGVMVADSKGATDTQNLSIFITNVNDNAPTITSNGGGDAASISVPQLTTAVTQVTSTDLDSGDVVRYTLSGLNSGLFTIDQSSGRLSFINAPVYDNSGINNTYSLTVTATDIAGNTDTQALTILVTNVDNIAPTLSISSSDSLISAGEIATITFTFSEAIKGFTISDITVTGGSLSNLVQDPSYPNIYRATFTQSGTSAAPSFSVASGSYQDDTGNTGSAATLVLNYDVVAPTVTVDIEGTDIAFGQTKTVTFTFSEDPAGTFTLEDIVTTNGVVTNLVQNTSDPKIFTASIQSTSSTGDAIVVAVNGSYSDAAGNLGSGGSDRATLASPSIDLANTSISDTGSSSTDNVTSNRKPVIVGNAPLSELTVKVTVTSGSTVLIYNNVTVTSGVWSLDLSTATASSGTMPSSGLAEGYVGLSVALNSSTSVTAASSFLIDFSLPTAPTVVSQTSTTATPTITGTTSTDTDVLKVTLNGITYTSGDGNLIYTKGGTNWSLLVPSVNSLSTGTYSVTAVAYDLAGNSNTDTTSGELTISINTNAPVLDLSPSDSLTFGNSATYTEGGNAVAFSATGISISDADSTNLSNLTVSYVATSVESGDRFELGSTLIYLASGTSTGTVVFNGTYFTYTFTTIEGTRYLQFTSRDINNTINAVASIASYEALLDALKFSNDSATFTNGSSRSFTVSVSDGSQSSSGATFSIAMVASDTPSVLVPDTQTVDEDNAATGNVLSNDSDVDSVLSVASFTVAGDATVYTFGQTATIAGQGTLTLASNGAYTFTPVANWNGTVPTVTYTTNTGSSSTLVITVSAVDASPITVSVVDDKDGIPQNVEEYLSTLSASTGWGGNLGDLNGDGIPDAQQQSVATLAWMTTDYYQEALSGQLAQVGPIISLEVLSPESGVLPDTIYQLENISVLAKSDARFSGIDSTVSMVVGQTISAPWDPIVFSIIPVNDGLVLIDFDLLRDGLQVRIRIDVSRSGLIESDFNGYLKFVSQATLDAAGGTLRDLDGNPITQAGWYDFLQRKDANGNFYGDGARFIISAGRIVAIELTFTDNAFGDADMTSNRVTDPGMPVYIETVTPTVARQQPVATAPSISKSGNGGLIILDLAKKKELEEEFDLKEEDNADGWATKKQFTTASLGQTALKGADTDLSSSPKPPVSDSPQKSSSNEASLRNTLTPPDALVGGDGKVTYQLPQGTFSGGQGSVNLIATMKDGSPLPAWISFDGATGALTGTVPPGMTQPIEVKIEARDAQGDKAETTLKIQPRTDKMSFKGKPPLDRQIEDFLLMRA